MTRQRVDVWLHRSRLFKTRSLAERAVERGGVRLARRGEVRLLTKGSEPIGSGDALVVATPAGVRSVRVLALATRRGPAAEARTLYEDAPEGP